MNFAHHYQSNDLGMKTLSNEISDSQTAISEFGTSINILDAKTTSTLNFIRHNNLKTTI